MEYNIKKYAVLVCMILIGLSCKDFESNADRDASLVNDVTNEFNEGDTLVMKKNLTAYQQWLDWHQQFDVHFNNSHFKSSGVSIHFDPFEKVNTPDSNTLLKELFIFAPDQNQYLDLYSYAFIKDNNQIQPGEADQSIVIGKINDLSSRKQVMFLGISQVAEFAQWVSNNSYLIGLNSATEKGDSTQYEIFLFNLKESSYINFILDHKLPSLQESFIESDIQKRLNNK